MNDIKEELTRNWLIKARRDLLSARQLAEGGVPLTTWKPDPEELNTIRVTS